MTPPVVLDGAALTYAPKRPSRRRAGQPSPTTPPRRGLYPTALTFDTGEYVAIVGTNGSGKSTLLRLISSEALPDSGTVTLFDTTLNAATPASQLRKVRARIGIAFATPSLDPVLTIRENLRLSAALHGLKHPDARISALTEQLGVSDRLDDRASHMSTGLLRRADLARVLLADPKLLLLDEPTSGLDSTSRTGFLDAIDRVRAADPHRTVVTVTHEDEEARRTQRVIVLSNGSVVADAPPDELARKLGSFVLVTTDAGLTEPIKALGLPPRCSGGSFYAKVPDQDTANRLLGLIASEGWNAALRRPSMLDASVILGDRASDSKEDPQAQDAPV